MTIETWTLGGLAALTTAILLLVGNLRKIFGGYKDSVRSIVKEEIRPLSNKIDELSRKVDGVDIDSTKNFLVMTIGEIERGSVDEVTRQRFYEEMERYEKLGGNSYIHARVEELRKQGKI